MTGVGTGKVTFSSLYNYRIMKGWIMENTRIRLLLKTIAQESATLRLLSYDPDRLKQQFGLSDAELEALRSAD